MLSFLLLQALNCFQSWHTDTYTVDLINKKSAVPYSKCAIFHFQLSRILSLWEFCYMSVTAGPMGYDPMPDTRWKEDLTQLLYIHLSQIHRSVMINFISPMLYTARSILILDCIDCQLQKGVNMVHIIDCCRGQKYAQYSLLFGEVKSSAPAILDRHH